MTEEGMRGAVAGRVVRRTDSELRVSGLRALVEALSRGLIATARSHGNGFAQVYGDPWWFVTLRGRGVEPTMRGRSRWRGSRADIRGIEADILRMLAGVMGSEGAPMTQNVGIDARRADIPGQESGSG